MTSSLRWKRPYRYDFAQTLVSHASTGSRLETVPRTDGAQGGSYRAVSRHALRVGGDKFAFKIQQHVGDNNATVVFGVGTSAQSVSASNAIEYRIAYYNGLTGTAGYAADLVLVSGDVLSWELSGTTLQFKQNGTVKGSWTGVTVPLYFQVYVDYSVVPSTPFAVYDAMQTTATAEPTASAAPTIVATSGHKRNHIAITYPSGANGVTIYRATSVGGYDYNQPVVTEWRYPHFEDTGLTNGTTYYYVARATKNGLSESVSSGEVSATPVLNNVPALPTDVAFIIGSPAVKPIGDAVGLRDTHFDQIAELHSMKWGLISPNREQHETIAGTVAVTNGGLVVTGTGTQFLTDYKADGIIRIVDSGGTARLYQIYYVDSDTQLTIWDNSSLFPGGYAGATESGLAHRPHYDDIPISDRMESYIHYYDLVLTLYHVYYRTGSLYHLALAQTGAQVWRLYIEAKKDAGWAPGAGANWSLNPRAISLSGLTIRALEVGGGVNQYWTTVKQYVDDKQGWVTQPISQGQFHYVRDEAYVIQYCSMIGNSYPDTTIRATYKSQALSWYLNYFEAEQAKYSDHVPRMDDFDFPAGGGGAGELYFHYHQPFIDAIYGECAVMVHKLTGNTTVKNGFLAWMDSTPNDYDNRMTTAGWRMRSPTYNAYQSMVSPIPSTYTVPAPVAPYDQHWTVDPTTDKNIGEPYPAPDINQGDPRFGNCISLSNYGYAYYLTGDAKYTTHANERMDSAYSGGDGRSARYDIMYTGKNINEAFRRSQSYLAYRDVVTSLGGGSLPADTTPPANVTHLVATQISASQINLDCDPPTDNIGVTGFIVQRATDAAFTQNVVTQNIPSAARPIQITGLAAATTYYFQIKATDAAGNASASYSNSANAATASGGGSAPSGRTVWTWDGGKIEG